MASEYVQKMRSSLANEIREFLVEDPERSLLLFSSFDRAVLDHMMDSLKDDKAVLSDEFILNCAMHFMTMKTVAILTKKSG